MGYLRRRSDAREGHARRSGGSREERRMGDSVYDARARVWKIEGVHREAEIATGARFEMGVHGVIKEHYGLEGKNLPLPVDYIVAATGG